MLVFSHEKFKRFKIVGKDDKSAGKQTEARNIGIFEKSRGSDGRRYCGGDQLIIQGHLQTFIPVASRRYRGA